MEVERIEAIRDALEGALDELTTAGFLAKGDFRCCNSCGHFGMKSLANGLKADGSPPKGYVFWHKQDDDSLEEHGVFYVRFAGNRVLQYPEAIPDEDVARTAVRVLESHGLKTDWNGDACDAIRVDCSRITY